MTQKTAEFKFLPFSHKQQLLLDWWRPGSPCADHDMVIADGSIRSGKTIACICSFLLWSLEAHQGQAFILAGKTIGALKKNVIRPMLQILTAWGIPYEYVRSGEQYIAVGSNIYYLYEAHNEASQDKIQGLTAAGAYADEAALFPRKFIEQMIGRCSVDGAKVYMNCNPDAPKHYILTEFIQQARRKNILHLHFMLEDNLSLSERTRDKYRHMYTGVFYKRFILGMWAAADGLVYQQFADDPEAFLVDSPPGPIIQAVIGVDFGGTKSGHAFQLVGFTRGYRHVVVLDEYYHDNVKNGRFSPKQVEDAFVDFAQRAKACYPVYEVRADSAEQTLIEGLTVAAMRAHLGVEIRNAVKGPINDRIAFYNSMMAQGRFCIMRHCKVTIAAFSDAVYDEDQKIKDVRLDDGTTNIDTLDATEYTTEPVQNEILYLGGG